MIGIIDYGLGNLFSLQNALHYLGCRFEFIKSPAEFCGKSGLILPGVGAFPEGMKKLNERGLTEALRKNERPLLGICLGMQLLFERGEEFGTCEGLGLIPGTVKKLTGVQKIPHVGWNRLVDTQNHCLVSGLPDPAFMYFVHSYAAETPEEYILAKTVYGQSVTAAAGKGNAAGTQFHPEKSGEAGLILLSRFCKEAEAQ